MATAPRFAWVAPDASEVSPRAVVATTSARWAELARDVRFRLANTWLSCEQVKRALFSLQPFFYK